MTVTLASTWEPRGELARFERLRGTLRKVFKELVLVLPPDWAHSPEAQALEAAKVGVVIAADWSHGRHIALDHAVSVKSTHILYADFDRLLHWVETRESELRATLKALETSDCLILGRTAQAYATHPRALVETEKISNAVGGHLLGQPMDLSAGAKGFSRRAARFLLKHSRPGNALGMDSEWPILLQRGGYRIDYRELEGLDWESADRHRDRAADLQAQRRAADEYDHDPANWERRVSIALEIVSCALDAWSRPLQ